MATLYTILSGLHPMTNDDLNASGNFPWRGEIHSYLPYTKSKLFVSMLSNNCLNLLLLGPNNQFIPNNIQTDYPIDRITGLIG